MAERKLHLAALLHHVSTIWMWLYTEDCDISLVQVIKSSRALDQLLEELKRALNTTQ